MRDDLSQIYYDAASDDIEYLFGDEITSISDDGDVDVRAHCAAAYDVIVGADGLHSGVRQLVFGPDVRSDQFPRRLSFRAVRAESPCPRRGIDGCAGRRPDGDDLHRRPPR